MKRILGFVIINLIFVLIQESFLSNLFGTFTPNLVLALAFSFIFLNLTEVGFMNAFIGGILLDLFGFETVGISSLIFITSLMVFLFARKYLFRGLVFSLFSSFVINTSYIFIISGFVASSKLLINGSISTAFFTLIFYFSIRNFSQLFKKPEYYFKE